MARRECDDFNELTIRDNISDSDVTLFYRMPSTKERQEYQNATIRRHGNKVEFNHAAARLKSGLAVLTGFKVGSFERLVDGKYVAFTWADGQPDFYPEWKEWIRKNASDLVMLMAARVFDASATIPGAEEPNEDDIEEK